MIAQEIDIILPWLHRDRMARRAPGVVVPITDELKRRVLSLVDADPDATMQEIATQVGLRNGARVSEIVNGLR